MSKKICSLKTVVLFIFLTAVAYAMPDYVHPIKQAQHSLNVTLKTDAARKDYIQAMRNFAQTNSFGFDVGDRAPKGNTIMITLTGKSTDLSSTSVFTRTVFDTYIYANSASAEDVIATDAMAKKFENFLRTKSFLTVKVEY